MEWTKYKRRTITEMRPWTPEDEPIHKGKIGDMVARDAENHTDQWVVTEEFFKANYDLAFPMDQG